MEKIIRQYEAKLGKVTVTEFDEGGVTEYMVKLHHHCFSASWHRDKAQAIAHAQFLAGRY